MHASCVLYPSNRLLSGCRAGREGFAHGKISYRCRESNHDSSVVPFRSLVVMPTDTPSNRSAYSFY
jgi:hypothetical protein